MPAILITGGTGKLGRELVRHFLDRGWEVSFTSTSRAGVDRLDAELGSPERLSGFVVDLTDANDVAELPQALSEGGTRVEFLVNNARNLDSLRIGPDGITDRSDFLTELLIDVVAPYELVMGLAATGELKGVVNVGSIYGLVAPNLKLYNEPEHDSPIQYGVAKAALVHLTKELAVRLSPRGIRVNCVAYGGFEGRVDEDFRARYARLTPSGRMLATDDLAGPVDFLCGSASSGMTGHTLVVDGGWTAW